MRPQATAAAGNTRMRYGKQPCEGKPRTLVSGQVVFENSSLNAMPSVI